MPAMLLFATELALTKRHRESLVLVGYASIYLTFFVTVLIISLWYSRLEVRELGTANLAEILESMDGLNLREAPKVLFESDRWALQMRYLSGITLARAVRVFYDMLWRNIPEEPPRDLWRVTQITRLLRAVLEELKALEKDVQALPEVHRLISKIELFLPLWEEAHRAALQ